MCRHLYLPRPTNIFESWCGFNFTRAQSGRAFSSNKLYSSRWHEQSLVKLSSRFRRFDLYPHRRCCDSFIVNQQIYPVQSRPMPDKPKRAGRDSAAFWWTLDGEGSSARNQLSLARFASANDFEAKLAIRFAIFQKHQQVYLVKLTRLVGFEKVIRRYGQSVNDPNGA